MNNPDVSWFSASMRVVCVISGVGEVAHDECVHVFRATDDSAFARAIELGRSHETECVNDSGDLVRWRLDRVVTLNWLADDLDGAEVYSSIKFEPGAAGFDDTFTPEAHEPTECV